MTTALIGYTGFVGSSLLAQSSFDDMYNSRNIADIRGKQYDFLVCAGAPALKWKANREPEQDLANLQSLMDHLGQAQVEKLVLISTVDVYADPRGVYERTPVEHDRLEPYGRHRFLLEQFVTSRFPGACVLRLPGLFGPGLKKNFIFDMIHHNALHLTHWKSVFQFYDLRRLWKDIQTTVRHNLPLVNIATEPVAVEEVAAQCFGTVFTNETEKPPAAYDMRTEFSAVFGAAGDYLIDKAAVLSGIRDFVRAEQDLEAQP